MAWRELTRESLEQTKAHFASRGNDVQMHAMALEVLLTTLGPEWWKTHCLETSPASFLDSKSPLEQEKLEHQRRVTQLADGLYCLRKCDGYEDFVEALKVRHLEATCFELEVARLLHKSEHVVRFVKQTGVKGADYDLSVRMGGTDVSVEAKSRRFREISDVNALSNALSTARDQLPKAGPGLIFVTIPTIWTQQPDAESRIGGAITAFFRNTARVNHVVLHWNVWTRVREKHAGIILFRQYNNANARHSFFMGSIIAPIRGPVPLPSFW